MTSDLTHQKNFLFARLWYMKEWQEADRPRQNKTDITNITNTMTDTMRID